MNRIAALPLAIALAACSAPGARPPPAAKVAKPPADVTLTVIGTNDLHGHVEALPLLGGFLGAVRATRGADAVLLLDAGDLFQGTLESNLGEGAGVVRAYGVLGYDATAIGNHEFDFGPVGPAATATSPADDPRGALEARAAEASFPFLGANLVDAATGELPKWKNVRASVVVVKKGVKIGLVGVTSEDTPRTTIAANFVGLRMTSLAGAITRESEALRLEGATVVVVLAHAGGKCGKLSEPRDTSSCARDEELMLALTALPPGLVDAVVAGHTHQAMAHYVRGIPVIESYAGGKAFGRIELVVDGASRRVRESRISTPTELRLPATYEGRAIEADAAVAAAIAPDVERARARKEQRLGVVLDGPIKRSYDAESAEGNLFADLMRTAQPGADVAMTNGGGLRADLPAGELRYGALFEAMPFDNRFATVRLRGRELAALVAQNLGSDKGILSLSGVRVRAACQGRELEVKLAREGGRPIGDDEPLLLVTTDFLATGGDATRFPGGSVTTLDALVRDGLEAGLRARAGHLREADPAIFDATRPRLEYPGKRPVVCAK